MNGGPRIPGYGAIPRGHFAPPSLRPASQEELAEYEKQQQEAILAQEHENRVIRWRAYVQIALTSMTLNGPDAKTAAKIADELCVLEDERFNKQVNNVTEIHFGVSDEIK